MLRLEKISKIYRTAEVETLALNEICMDVRAGEFVAIMGPSGCGKSTLLNVLGLLDSPTSGAFEFFGEEVSKRSERELTALRRDRIGFVFQSFNLIDDLSVAENVEVSRAVGASRTRRSGLGGGGPCPAMPCRPRSAPSRATASMPASPSPALRWASLRRC